MKFVKLAIITGLLSVNTVAKADVGIFFGISYTFGGGGPGISLKAISSKEEDKAVIGAGVSYYPLSTNANNFGADVSIGYNFNNSGVMIGYDFLQSGVQIGLGYVNTDDDNTGVGGVGGVGGVVDSGPIFSDL